MRPSTRGGYREDFQRETNDNDDYYTRREPDLSKEKEYSDNSDGEGRSEQRDMGFRGRGRGGGGRGGGRGRGQASRGGPHNQRNRALKKRGI